MFYQKHQVWLEESIGTRISKLFDKKYRIEEYKEGHFRLKISSMELYKLWKNDYGFPKDGVGQGSWLVPSQIRNANSQAQICYIRGVFDADGDVSPTSSKTCYVGISQKNVAFLEDIRSILIGLNIHPGKTHVIDKKSNTHRIAISEKKSLLRFIMIVGSEHPIKSSTLQKVRNLL
jgi:intein-encoded DNA endonuclease-like protein